MNQITIKQTTGKEVNEIKIIDGNLLIVFSDRTFICFGDAGIHEIEGIEEKDISSYSYSEVFDYIKLK